MNSFRKSALAVVGIAILPALAACSPAADTPAEDPTAAAPSAGLTVSNARLVLPPVSGNPAVVYFDLSYNGAPGVSLTGVAVEGAGMTMLHDNAETDGKMQMVTTDAVPLTQGTPVSFKPGGLHVMAMEPSDALKAGGMAKVTFTLSDGMITTVDVPVRAAGDER